jgi:hypothetical protein
MVAYFRRQHHDFPSFTKASMKIYQQPKKSPEPIESLDAK